MLGAMEPPEEDDDEKVVDFSQVPPGRAGLGKRMRAARQVANNGKKLGLDAAAAACGVSRSTIQRWESGENSPARHWAIVERVYKRSRMELEWGLAQDSDPPYAAWQEFLDWLEAEPNVSKEAYAVDSARHLRLPDGQRMTLDGYKMYYFTLLAMPRSSSK